MHLYANHDLTMNKWLKSASVQVNGYIVFRNVL